MLGLGYVPILTIFNFQLLNSVDNMYKLTLTREELSALEWIGGRYAHGTDFLNILNGCPSSIDDMEDEQAENVGEVTFTIPEHKAWEISDLLREETEDLRHPLPCLSSEFDAKLVNLCMEIV